MIQQQETNNVQKFNFKKIFRGLFLCAIIGVTFLALLPAEKTFSFSAVDKINHLVAYVVLSFLAVSGFRTKRKVLSTLVICAALVMYGIIIEWIQGFVGREPSWWDVAANVSGIGLGIIITKVLP